MSAPAPASRRTTSGSRRFNPLKALQPKRRLQQILASSPVPAPSKPASGSGTSAAAATASVAIPVPAPPARAPSAPSNRDPHGNASVSSGSNSGSCKGSECSPTKGRQKYTSCTDNHGIRPPPPEQYLTPLQQKEVCIRHLRAKLKETINTLQDRDTEIDELRTQLYRMQEDWVEEECHRVEAQLALKEARQEIQQLKHAVDTVRSRLSDAGGLSGDIGVQKYFQDINTQNHKLENLLLSMELAQAGLAKEGEAIKGCRTRAGGSAPASVSGESPGGVPKLTVGGRGSCSCDGSPARSLTRSSTYTKLSDQALGDRNCNDTDFPCLSGDGTQDSGFVCCGESSVPSRADLLLEAAYLSEETASLLNSYTQAFSHTLPHPVPQSVPHTFSHTLPHSFPHNMSHSMPHSMPHSSTYEKLCTGERLAPFHCGLGGVSCMSHPCLSHHHLYLHPLREAGIQTESCPIPATAGYPSDLDTIAEQRTFRSQACSPTSTWMSDEGEEDLDSITTTTSVTTATVMSTATEPIPVSKTPLVPPLPRSATVAFSVGSPWCQANDRIEEEEKQEKEKREKEDTVSEEELENTEIRQSEEEQQTDKSLVEETEIDNEEAERKVCDLAAISTRMQTELDFEGAYGDGKQYEMLLRNQNVEDKQQETGIGERSTEVKTPEMSPGYTGLPVGVQTPQTSQPPRRTISHDEMAGVTVVEVHDEDDDTDKTSEQGATGGAGAEDEDSSGKIQKKLLESSLPGRSARCGHPCGANGGVAVPGSSA